MDRDTIVNNGGGYTYHDKFYDRFSEAQRAQENGMTNQNDRDGHELNIGDKVKRAEGRGGMESDEPEGTIVGFNHFGAPIVRFEEPLSFNGQALRRIPQETWEDAGDEFRIVDANGDILLTRPVLASGLKIQRKVMR